MYDNVCDKILSYQKISLLIVLYLTDFHTYEYEENRVRCAGFMLSAYRICMYVCMDRWMDGCINE
jgi:hypothetical protein